MSAHGTKQTSNCHLPMSAFGGKADADSFQGRNPAGNISFSWREASIPYGTDCRSGTGMCTAKRLVEKQNAVVRQLERAGACNAEAINLLNNLREQLAARERRLSRVRSFPSSDHAA
jgi:hypothetical protein